MPSIQEARLTPTLLAVTTPEA